MSRLDELIAELCPEGVEFIELGNVCEIRSGWGFPNIEQGNQEGEYPFYKVGDMNLPGNEVYMIKANNYITSTVAKKLKCNPAPKETIVFPKIGAAIGTNKKRILSCSSCYDNNVMGLIAKEDIICPKYLYYIMTAVPLNRFADYSGALPSIRKSTMEKHSIPVPPLPVQREIVKILDIFTELTTELTTKLTAELTARQKQYKYYASMLFENAKGIKPTTLEEVSTNCDYLRKPVTSGKREAGAIPYYGASGIVDYVRDYILDGEYLLISEDGANLLARSTPIAFSISGKAWVNNHAHILKFHSITTQKYVERYLNLFDLTPFITGAAQPKLNQKNLNTIQIPLPPMDEQERIMAILDRFDIIANDITSGLPAEIVARKKQYEYYQDKLLTFEQKR